MSSFGSKLRIMREGRKISLEKLSKELGISKMTLFRYEYNETDPKVSYLRQIANYFNTSMDYLIEDNREDYKFNLFVRMLVEKLTNEGFDFETMPIEEKEALADLLVLSVKQIIEVQKIIEKSNNEKNTD